MDVVSRRLIGIAALIAAGTWGGLTGLPNAVASDSPPPGHLEVNVHYIAFRDATGQAITDENTVNAALDHASKEWAQCDIGFKLEKFEAVDPSVLASRYSPANYNELDIMRQRGQSNHDLLIVGTGPWDRSGDLGDSGSNCYSTFPGDSAQGIVCERSQASSPMMLSHESGHWMNLMHPDDPSNDGSDGTKANDISINLMNHMVAPDNTQLLPQQCQRARAAVDQYRKSDLVI
jgi:hypothetical protein